jgi:hypothetical protein
MFGALLVSMFGMTLAQKSYHHEITWVDTLPPEWYLPGSAILTHGIDIITGLEKNREIFQFTYGSVADAYSDDPNKKEVKKLQMSGANQVFFYADQMDVKPYESCAFDSTSEAYSRYCVILPPRRPSYLILFLQFVSVCVVHGCFYGRGCGCCWNGCHVK